MDTKKKKKIKFKVVKKDGKKVKKRPPPALTKEQQQTPLSDLLFIDTPIAKRFTKKGTFLGLFDKEEDALFDPFFDGELLDTPSVPTSTMSVGLPEVKKKRRYRKKK